MASDLRTEIERLYIDYARAATEHLEDWPGLFTDDASYQIISRENVERDLPLAALRCDGHGMLSDRVRSIRTSAFYTARTMRYLVGLLDVAELDDGYRVRANFAAYQSLSKRGSDLFCVGEYEDHVVRTRSGDLRFAHKQVIYDGDIVIDSIVYPL